MFTRKHSTKMLVMVAVLLLAPVLVFPGCTRQVSWISLDPKSVELNKAGETFQIKAAALDKENKPVPTAKLNWESTNPQAAVVDANGLITAKGSGNTMITALAENGEKAVVQCKVSILSAIKVQPDQLELAVGEKSQLEVKVLNEKGELFEDQVVGWAVSDPKVVFIDDLGEVTAVTPGEATITATTPSKGLSHVYGSCKITVKAAQ
jgi:uncharacterized protein YjdB